MFSEWRTETQTERKSPSVGDPPAFCKHTHRLSQRTKHTHVLGGLELKGLQSPCDPKAEEKDTIERFRFKARYVINAPTFSA